LLFGGHTFYFWRIKFELTDKATQVVFDLMAPKIQVPSISTHNSGSSNAFFKASTPIQEVKLFEELTRRTLKGVSCYELSCVTKDQKDLVLSSLSGKVKVIEQMEYNGLKYLEIFNR